MAIPTTLLAKVLAGLGVVATAATVIGVTANRPKNGDTQEKSPTPEDLLKALNDKIKKLGIEGCEFTEGETKKENCTLDKEKIGKVKFDGKAEGASVSEGASLSLTIEKGYEGFKKPVTPNDLYFPEGIRFIFKNTNSNDITIGDNPNQITFKSSTTYDYKIKTSGNTTTLEKAWDLATLNEIVGLQECTTASDGDNITECSFRTGSVNVWRNENDYLTRGGAASGSTDKKMKVTKNSAGYRQGLKFYFDQEEDFSGDNNKRIHLNPNTNYEIDIREATIHSGQSQRKEKKWFLVDKTNEDLNEKIKGLGISGCELGNEQSKTKECELDETKVKAIKFSNKPESSDLTVTGLDPNKKLHLVIERDYKNTEFSSGLRFTLTNKNTEDVTIGSSSNSPITLKANTSYDFKIKTEGNKLEKAWTLKSLADKVGITCTNDTDTECTLKTTGINVWKEEGDYITGATQSETDKKITITKDQKGYLEGFKFTIKESDEDITLTAGTKKKTNGISKLTKTGKAYGIDVKDIGGIKTWFLIEKSTSVPA